MATDFTQDTVLRFLQTRGGSVTNSELLLYFRRFIRDHADRDRNRELFKTYVNAVATVQQVDSVSHVVLRRKFKERVPGGGQRGAPPVPDRESARHSPAGRDQSAREVTSPTGATALPAAGIVLNNNDVVNAPEVPGRPAPVPVQTPGGGHGPPPRETLHQPPVPEPLGRRSAGSLRQEPDPHPQVVLRHKHRPSYKAAVSYDEDEEEEQSQTGHGSAGGAWPWNAPLGASVRAMSASSPCLVDPCTPPAVLSSSSSEGLPPKIYIQDVRGDVLPSAGPGREGWAGSSLGPGSAPEQSLSTTSSEREEEAVHRLHVRPSSGEQPPWSAAGTGGVSPGQGQRQPKIREALQRAQRAGIRLDGAGTWRRSADQDSAAPVAPWRLSTGDLHDGREEAESSEGSALSAPLRQRPAVAGRVSSLLRNRMCRSLGADLDHLLQEEARGEGAGGSEAARLARLQLISSTLSLPYKRSSSSLSSCSTPPRCHSLADLMEGIGGKWGQGSLPAASSLSPHHEGPGRPSLVPLEPREHSWLVKGAAGAWPDIYSLFREDSSLLNRRDFVSGFTVLHWIAKHGDHRVLNTLWYGVDKAGLTLDVNAKSTAGHTPLHIAAIHGNKNIMRLLVSKFNADVRLRDMAGKRPWQYLSRAAPLDVFQLLGAPSRAAGRADGGRKPEQPQRRHRRHHFSTASSGQRPVTIAGTKKVKRSSSIAAFLKHKSLRRFHGHQSDSSV
ncbi:ankyrin repeat domain-containing protein SOWAHB-like [Brachionichthys hirsutus]|uniref:ankyrin repeat domain-containing protein SOWAHB-like n=1 Tax=Brachionichthys hirsutus TaxID=412623 RepID=UPI0036044926